MADEAETTEPEQDAGPPASAGLDFVNGYTGPDRSRMSDADDGGEDPGALVETTEIEDEPEPETEVGENEDAAPEADEAEAGKQAAPALDFGGYVGELPLDENGHVTLTADQARLLQQELGHARKTITETAQERARREREAAPPAKPDPNAPASVTGLTDDQLAEEAFAALDSDNKRRFLEVQREIARREVGGIRREIEPLLERERPALVESRAQRFLEDDGYDVTPEQAKAALAAAGPKYEAWSVAHPDASQAEKAQASRAALRRAHAEAIQKGTVKAPAKPAAKPGKPQVTDRGGAAGVTGARPGGNPASTFRPSEANAMFGR